MTKLADSTVSPLRAFRIEHLQISAQDAADQLGVHKTTYCRLEVGGNRMPKKEHLRTLAAWLRKQKAPVTLEQVLFPEESPVTIRLTSEPAGKKIMRRVIERKRARTRGARA